VDCITLLYLRTYHIPTESGYAVFEYSILPAEYITRVHRFDDLYFYFLAHKYRRVLPEEESAYHESGNTEYHEKYGVHIRTR